jgi:hypothetical protein
MNRDWVRRGTGVLALALGAIASAQDQPAEPCGSAVVVRCSNAPAAPEPGSFAAEVARTKAQLEKQRERQRARLDRAGTIDDGTLESAVITGERINPNSGRFQRFGDQVHEAAVPECASFAAAGLLAIPLVPILAVSGKCRVHP